MYRIKCSRISSPCVSISFFLLLGESYFFFINNLKLTLFISVDFFAKLSLLRLDVRRVICALTIRIRLAFWDFVVMRCLLGVEELDISDSLLIMA